MVALTVVAVLVAALSTGARADVPDPNPLHSLSSQRITGSAPSRPAALARPLVFGIYPGGGAGTVGQAGQTVAEDPTKRLAALERLRAPGQPFVLHIYASYTGPESDTPADQVGSDIANYTAAGFQIELVLTYRPAHETPVSDVPGFAEFARSAVRAFGSNPGFVALQVTNEANIRGAPNAADGSYPGAEDALIEGVIAAKTEARARRYSQIAVGFNWAYSLDPSEPTFWRGLGTNGGGAFRNALDWVGLDLYPGTWGPRSPGDLTSATARTVQDALAALRYHYMPLAGLSADLPLRIAENGYPTGPGRTEAMQTAVMKTAISTIDANRATYHITDYRWFDLRDADSSNASFESQYGLMDHDYAPKAAFAVYRNLVAALGIGNADRAPTTGS
jgi:hypothetical protein